MTASPKALLGMDGRTDAASPRINKVVYELQEQARLSED